MGLNSEITADIANAFDTDLADAVKDFTGTHRTLIDDDWLLNGTNTHATHSYSGRGVFSGFASSEIDGNTILQNDVKLICLQSQIERTPLVDDIINQMRVVAVSKDPADVAWVIQLRGV